MVRGTFANVRLAKPARSRHRGRPAPFTCRTASELSIYEASRRYAPRGRPASRDRRQGVRLGLVARLGGEGTQSPRRQAVIAESYERIHRSNLVDDGHRTAPVRGRRFGGIARPHGPGVFDITGLDGEAREALTVSAPPTAREARSLPGARTARYSARARISTPRRDPPCVLRRRARSRRRDLARRRRAAQGRLARVGLSLDRGGDHRSSSRGPR